MTVPNDCSLVGIEVEVGSIEKELKKLWEADKARTNASLINFAVYSENGNALENNSQIISEITREHACRALLIAVDRQRPEASMRAWITAHCNVSNGNKTVCSEQVAFHLTGRVQGRIANTIFAHLHSDLPLIFWWQGELTERFNPRLYTLMQRLVLDSSQWSDLSGQFQLVYQALQNGLVVQDLSWTRTYYVRLSIAAIFDDPVAQRAATAISKVRIQTSEEGFVAGLQLLAWMAELAGWNTATELIASDDSCGSYRFEHDHGGMIEASVVMDAHSAAIGLVEIEAGDVLIQIERKKGESLLHVHLESTGYVLDQSVPAESEEVVGLVKDQLSRGGKNSLFRKVFPRFLQLLGE